MTGRGLEFHLLVTDDAEPVVTGSLGRSGILKAAVSAHLLAARGARGAPVQDSPQRGQTTGAAPGGVQPGAQGAALSEALQFGFQVQYSSLLHFAQRLVPLEHVHDGLPFGQRELTQVQIHDATGDGDPSAATR